ncbi:MAG: hypothetical protein HRU38_24030 [Saccharospirillaceae bacterium]|nr:hypothetical protein [Saccharospirillaceae bacterium]
MSNYQINQDKCKLIDLVEEFRELSLKYEEDNHTKCGFKDASMYQYDIISAIQNGRLNQKYFDSISEVFTYFNKDFSLYVEPVKKNRLLSFLFSKQSKEVGFKWHL